LPFATPPVATPHATAVHVAQSPVLDGRLDDAAWQLAPAADVFTQKSPREGAPPSETTTVRVVYDDEALWIGVDCPQKNAPVVARLTRRDREVEADWVSVSLDTRRDGKSAFVFEVNAGGALLDAVRFNDGDFSADWDENWDARVSVGPHGWSAEYRIPFRILRYQSLPEQSWGFEVRRYVSMKQETDEWALISRAAGGEVSHYGRLDGLVGLSARTPFELRPFALARVRRQDATSVTIPTLGNTTFTGTLPGVTDFSPSVGLDLKWHATQDLTLDATINPDFAQVEADQLVLNLTTYETYYPEKRPFFLEGTELFATPFQLLYTRRIGRVPPMPTLRPNEQLLDVPQPTMIWGASKLTGRIADGWTVGTVQALTATNTVPVLAPDGSHVARVVAPLSAWNVLRVRRDVGERAYVGLTATNVTHAESTGDYPVVSGSPAQALCPASTQAARSTTLVTPGSRCFADAYAGGVDFRWRSEGGDWAAVGQAVASMLDHGPPRTVPDGTVIKPGDVGTGAAGYFGKEGGEHWVGDVWAGYNDRKFDDNDVGYNQRGNAIWDGFDLEYRTLEPWWKLLETHTRLEYWDNESMGGLLLSRGAQANTAGKLSSFWRYFLELHWREARFDDREFGDGTALERAGIVGTDARIQSDTTKPVAVGLHARPQALAHGGYNLYADGDLLVRILPQLDVDVAPTYTANVGEPRYVTTGSVAGEYLLGHLDAKSLGATLRATYTFAPRLSLTAYAQLFLASGHYSGFLTFLSNPNGPLVHLDDLRPAPPPFSNPDFEQAALNVNVVLRWEYSLGSLLYLVYQRAQVPSVSLSPGEQGTLDFGSLGRAPAADVFIVKASYWWG
jgi:hypothetical protein